MLTLRQRDLVALAHVRGCSALRIMLTHILPNVLDTFMVLVTLDVGVVIVAEASPSFFGAGIPPPTPAWGMMIAERRRRLADALGSVGSTCWATGCATGWTRGCASYERAAGPRGPRPAHPFLSAPRRGEGGRRREVLRRVEIAASERRLGQYPHQMSGGMKQRVVGAIAISGAPAVLIADEPTTALDVTIRPQYPKLLEHLQAEIGMAILFIAHELLRVIAEKAPGSLDELARITGKAKSNLSRC